MKKILNLNFLIFLGLVLGILGGILLPEFMPKISFIGEVYINLLKLIILPVIFTTVTIAAYRGLSSKKLGIIKSIVLFVIVFIIVFLLTSLVFKLVNIGEGYKVSQEKFEIKTESFDIGRFFVNTFPSSVIDVIKDNNLLFAIIFAGIFALACFKEEKGSKAIEIIESLAKIFNKIVGYIIWLTPLAIISLIGNVIVDYGTDILSGTLKYIALVYLISVITIVVFTLIVLSRIKTLTYVRKVFKIALMTLSTCSSLATLPFALKLIKEEKNLDKEKVDIILPLGVAISKIGGAISFAALAIFTTQIYGIQIDLAQYVLMIFLALVINFSAAGIPGGGIVVGSAYLSALGLPLGFIGIYAGIYRILDMAYTSVNMNANVSIATLMSGRKEIEIKEEHKNI